MIWNAEISYFTFDFLNNLLNLVVCEELLKDPCIQHLDSLDFDDREQICLGRNDNKSRVSIVSDSMFGCPVLLRI